MRAEKPHRLPRRRAHGRLAKAAHDALENGFRGLARMNDAGGDAQRPDRGRDQERRRFDVAIEPAAGGELVLDQPVRGRGIGHAKQRLRQHHQREALLGRERISVQKFVDAAESARPGADRLDEPPRAGIDAALRGRLARGAGKQACRQFLVRRRIRSLKCWQPGIQARPFRQFILASPALRGAIRRRAPATPAICRCSWSSPFPCPADRRRPFRRSRCRGCAGSVWFCRPLRRRSRS